MLRLLSRLSACVLLCLVGCQGNGMRGDADPAVPVADETQGTNYGVEGPDGPSPQTEFSSTPSGLKYRVLREGTGRKPTPSDFVSVSYRGWLDDGNEFDSSYNRNEPTNFPLNGVIPGWTEGMQLVGEGGKIELEIPSDLGYGPQGMPGAIPPNATLHFIVELHRVR